MVTIMYKNANENSISFSKCIEFAKVILSRLDGIG